MSQLLSLTEYSTKYQVSVSTLRRRIRSDKVAYVKKDGKYFLEDQPLKEFESTDSNVQKAPKNKHAPPSSESRRRALLTKEKDEHKGEKKAAETKTAESTAEVEVLLEEIKSAYRTILSEKEEQILLLREEVSDLKTLVQVLETENQRLIRQSKVGESMDSWLEQSPFLDK